VTATAGGLDLARRSLELILRWQTPSGAFIAGPTFSQYGYCWFRDGAFIAEALDVAGRLDEAGRFHDWVAGVVLDAADGMRRAMTAAAAGDRPGPDDYLHCRYTADGGVGPDDWPTFQLDGPGIWLWSLAHHVRCGGTLTDRRSRAAELVAAYLAALRETPASDAWEEAPEFVHTSTRGAILAGLRAAAALGLDQPALAEARVSLEASLLRPDARWTKWAASDAVDGSLLWLIAPYALVPPGAAAASSALVRIEHELEDADGGVHRYLDDTYYGGGGWPILTAALARARLRRGGPADRAAALRGLAWIEAQADEELGLPEQVATRALHPGRVAEWRASWGESARPLLWSHAAYLVLRHDLGLPTA
jgi:GH15 family glucan-1,4-alpha-glucosidase